MLGTPIELILVFLALGAVVLIGGSIGGLFSRRRTMLDYLSEVVLCKFR